MSDTDTNDSERRATGTQASDTDRISAQYGLLGPGVAFALLVGVGVGHYAVSRLAISERSTSSWTRRSRASANVLYVGDDFLLAILSKRSPPDRMIVLKRPREIPCLAQKESQSAINDWIGSSVMPNDYA